MTNQKNIEINRLTKKINEYYYNQYIQSLKVFYNNHTNIIIFNFYYYYYYYGMMQTEQAAATVQ